eukprot:TRINITY_DN3790_c0_g1_i1.p1 TRINITY_DN3790_c0_g1~~TRINITY_DN3790_c0_g1_i1.p1  ORF type:complete len:1190 (-),score=317.12 TRINITY_DN3790_c0_g1_i1:16-3396(-)
MTTLGYLHAPAIMHNLSLRFAKDVVYTYSGRTCIAVNPFKWLDLYNPTMIQSYHGAAFGDRDPHIFAVGELSYASMLAGGGSQSILVSGESGAGKTETTKLLLKYLAHVASGGTKTQVAEQVLQSNPLLEAFGNAKTLRNDNSSRFGKFIEVQFGQGGHIVGARTQTYLLEKSRVVHLSEGERNYHIFYQLLAGADEQLRAELQLRDPKAFHFLNQSSAVALEGIDDAHEFAATCRAMETILISKEDQNMVFRTVAAILHLGQVAFRGNHDDSSSVSNPEALKPVCGLLSVSESALEAALTRRTLRTRTEVVHKSNNAAEALAARDALAKNLYGRMFDWLVGMINQSMRNDGKSQSFVGVLDIFGFECFKSNSFEQLCINYANEKLQQQYTQDVFKTVQDEYQQEGITWSYVDFVDNQACVDLIEKNYGIVSLLNEECVLPKGSDSGFLSKLESVHASHGNFTKRKLDRTAFIISHYAGDVSYDVTGFLEKNKDSLSPDLISLIQNSGQPWLRNLFPASASTDTGKVNSRDNFLGSQFRSQLTALMTTISATTVQYIRCIKPNNLNKPNIFDKAKVAAQLRYAGVLEAIRISRSAYPNRVLHPEFLRRFYLLDAKKSIGKATSPAEQCSALAAQLLNKGEYQVGTTRVYFRYGCLEKLEQDRGKLLSRAAVVMQRVVRGFLARRRYAKHRKLCIFIQACVRRLVAKKKYRQTRRRVIVVQALVRRRQAIKHVETLRRNTAATNIQKVWRGAKARRSYQQLQKAVVFIQSLVRMRRQRRKYLVKLEEKREEAKMATQLRRMQERLKAEEEKNRKLLEQLSNPAPQVPTVAETSGSMSFIPVAATAPAAQAAVVVAHPTQPADDDLLSDAGSLLRSLQEQLRRTQERLAAETERNEDLEKITRKLTDDVRQLDVKLSLEMKTKDQAQEKLKKQAEELQRQRKLYTDEARERAQANEDLQEVVKALKDEMQRGKDLDRAMKRQQASFDRKLKVLQEEQSQRTDDWAKKVSDLEARLKKKTEELAEFKKMYQYQQEQSAAMALELRDLKERFRDQILEDTETGADGDAGEPSPEVLAAAAASAAPQKRGQQRTMTRSYDSFSVSQRNSPAQNSSGGLFSFVSRFVGSGQQ